MKVTRAITVRLAPDDYRRLEAEAERLGMPPATLVRLYVRAGLNGNGANLAERNRRVGLEALDRLAELTKNLPPIDIAPILQEGRDDLERRPTIE